jgi:hypothetical protein
VGEEPGVTVLVAIPYFGVQGELVDKAVRHALAQTAETIVLVVGDGQRPPISFMHDRLVVGTFPEHRGAPFVQQAMILGSPFQWYAPHGADDWIEPDHVASLLALRAPVNGSGRIFYHERGKVRILASPRTFIEFGCIDTGLLRAVGGYNAGEPCGQDSVLITVLTQSARVRLSRRPTYHKLHRADSLTHDPKTRGGSPLRTAVRVRNRKAILEMRRIGYRNRERIRAFRESLVPAAIRAELEDRAALVARWLS